MSVLHNCQPYNLGNSENNTKLENSKVFLKHSHLLNFGNEGKYL